MRPGSLRAQTAGAPSILQTPTPPALIWRKLRAHAEPGQRPKGLKHKGPASRRPRFEMGTRPQCLVSLDIPLARSRFPYSPPHPGLHSPKPEPTHSRTFFPQVLPLTWPFLGGALPSYKAGGPHDWPTEGSVPLPIPSTQGPQTPDTIQAPRPTSQ